jgi:hypothetical protein
MRAAEPDDGLLKPFRARPRGARVARLMQIKKAAAISDRMASGIASADLDLPP